MKSDDIFEKVFCSNVKEPILNDNERALARFIYGVAVDEIRANRKDPEDNNVDEANRKINLNKEIGAKVKIFKDIVDLFKESQAAKTAFLNNIDRWSSSRKSNISGLRKIAEVVQTDKFNCDVSRVVGSSVGVAGGIALALSFIPFLAPITLPIGIAASASGAATVIGASSAEIARLKSNLEEAKKLLKQEESSSSNLNDWFNHAKKITDAIDSLIETSLLKEMCEDLTSFQDKIKKETNLTVDELKKLFNHLLKSFIGKMHKFSRKITAKSPNNEDIAPVVMTFVIVVCLLRQRNRLIFNCIGQMYRVMAKHMNVSDAEITAGEVMLMVSKSLISVWRIFAISNIALDVLTMVQSSIDIHKRTEVAQAKQIKEAALKMEEECSLMKKAYDEVKKWSFTD